MALWKIEPRVPPDDPAWQDQAVWGEVIVRARTAGLARMAAANFDRHYGQPPVGDASLSYRSAFESDFLYRVSKLDAVGAARHGGEEGPEGIVCAKRLGVRQPSDEAVARRAAARAR